MAFLEYFGPFQGEYRAKAKPFTMSRDYHQLHLKRVSFTKKLWIAKVHIKPQKLLSNVVTPSIFFNKPSQN